MPITEKAWFQRGDTGTDIAMNFYYFFTNTTWSTCHGAIDTHQSTKSRPVNSSYNPEDLVLFDKD